ncbi:teneurin-3 [uncultured Ruminococcus sp.]|uniref:teneurin-3 n=1 Tax=uncultured Ruminococcus sp. TaxID=165186 RepID=UPI0026017E7E|nr:teneurin-3 [uncultured Ruminococcus sp.]
MSKRTSDASKAIRKAWQQEQERVLEGKGTRDWTPEQQQDIIEKGKAYDSDGKAFHGQHMKSAEKYPEFQGDADNIQFLTQKEHLAAHKGKWTNPTNWYYDPVTHVFTDFGEVMYIPCAVINLSYPVNRIDLNDEKTEDNRPEKANQKESASYSKESKQTSSHKFSDTKPKPTEEKTGFLSRAKGLLKNAVAGGKKAVQWGVEHKELIGAIAVGISTVAVAKTKTVNNSSASDSTDSQNDNTYPSDDFGGSYSEKTDEDSFDVEEHDDIENETTEKPYTPNDVPAGGQHYHYKDGSVKWKEKAPYSRGKKKNDDE